LIDEEYYVLLLIVRWVVAKEPHPIDKTWIDPQLMRKIRPEAIMAFGGDRRSK
jgi:hypothetical protein